MKRGKTTTIRISIDTRDTLNEIKDELKASSGWGMRKDPPSFDTILQLLFNRYKDDEDE